MLSCYRKQAKLSFQTGLDFLFEKMSINLSIKLSDFNLAMSS